MNDYPQLTARFWSITTAVLALFFCADFLRAADAFPPGKMTFQGFLTDANGVPLGNTAPRNYNVVFRIYKEASGTTAALWAEQQTVTVDKGYFTVLLGEGSQVGSELFSNNLSGLFSASDASDRFVETTVKGLGAGGTDVKIVPRLQLQATPYSFLSSHAKNAEKVADYDGLTMANAIVPVGGIIMWFGDWNDTNLRPKNFELCDGGSVSTQGSPLLGRNKPNLIDRFPKGAPSGRLDVTSVAYGGANTIPTRQSGGTALSIDQMPRHDHAAADSRYSWLLKVDNTFTIGGPQFLDNIGEEPDLAHAGKMQPQGGNQPHDHSIPAHDNRPAYAEVLFIIRVK
jgi:hypothetical protein